MTHDIITRDQYSHLVAAVIGSAVIPTVIANAYFLPHYLLPKQPAVEDAPTDDGLPLPEPVGVPSGATTR
jgi:hypothetical protein